ncbi:MAG TPA: toxin-antitoxin system YwqK family antitoxin [Chthoniobacterales bacterium]
MKSLFASLLIAVVSLQPLFAQDQGAEPGITPTATPTPLTPPLPALPKASPPSATPAAAVELYSLDYNETLDLFCVPGTPTGYTGRVISTYDNGKQELVGALKAGKREGRWLEYAEEEGTLTSAGDYLDGKETGEWKYWFENGQLLSVGSYTDGKPTGRWKTYYENGKPESEGVYVDGEMDGDWKVFDDETNEVRTLKFKNGEQIP